MKRFKRFESPCLNGIGAGVSIIALAASTGCWAAATQAEAEANTTSLTEIVVTATKRKMNIQDVPAALAAVGAERLSVERIENLEQIRSVPAFSADTAFGRDQNQYYLRGITTYNGNEGTSSSVAIYQDEVFLDSPSFGSEPLFDLERVEILYGPQGTLWGQNSTAGAVNIVTQKPEKQFGGYGSLVFGKYNELNAEGAVTGPLRNDTLTARLSFVRQARDGWVRNTFNGQRLNEYADEAVRGQLLWTPSDSFSALIKVKARDLSGNGAATYFGDGLLPGNTNYYGYQYSGSYDSVAINVANPVNELKSRGVALTLKSSLSFAELTVLGSYDEADGQTRFDDDATPVDLETFHNVKSAEQEDFDIRLTSPDNGRISWILGATYFHGLSRLQQQFYSLLLDPLVGDGPYGYGIRFNQDKTNSGAYGSLTFRLTDRFSIIAGARYTKERINGNIDNVVYRINPVTPEQIDTSPEPFIPLATQHAKISSSEPTGDLTFQFQPVPAVNLYAKAARGYRGGGFNQAAFSQAAASFVRPEYVWSYEVGAKTNWLSNRLTVNVAAYRSNFSDLQRQSYVNNALTLFNAGTATYTGGEVDVTYSPVEDLSLHAGVAYVKRHIFGYRGAGPDGNIYDVDFNKPFTTANLSINKRWDLGESGAVTFNTSWNYWGTQYLRDVIPPDPVWAFLVQSSFWNGDASLAYQPKGARWRISAWGKNITNVKTSLHASPQPYFGLSVSTHRDPRTYGVGFSFDF